MDLINPMIDKMPNIIEDYLKLSFDNVMNKYNFLKCKFYC